MQAAISAQFGAFSQFLTSSNPGPESFDNLDRESQQAPFRVLVLEASVPLARLLATGLLTDCSSVEVSHDLDAGLKQFEELNSELLIVDLDLPGLDSAAFLHELRARRQDVSVLALSGRGGIEDMVAALDNGADDYLAKPFSLLELMARVRALRRRSQGMERNPAPKSTSLVLRRDECRVERDGRLIDLTPREFTLLEYLVQNPGRTLSRAVLSQEVWNMPVEGNTNIVDVYIKYLRDKIDGNHNVKLIRTVRGMGYSYQANA